MPRRLPIVRSEILRDKRIMAVGYDDDVLEVIEEELSIGVSDLTFQSFTIFEDAFRQIVSYPYDLVILHMESAVWGSDFLQIAQDVGIPVVILTSRKFMPQDLKKSVEMGARAYLPIDTIGSLIPILEDVIELTRVRKTQGGFWREFWSEFEHELVVEDETLSRRTKCSSEASGEPA